MTSPVALTATSHLVAPVSITVLVIATRLATVQYGAADLAYNCYSAGHRRGPSRGRSSSGLKLHPQPIALRSPGTNLAAQWVMPSAFIVPVRCTTKSQALSQN